MLTAQLTKHCISLKLWGVKSALKRKIWDFGISSTAIKPGASSTERSVYRPKKKHLLMVRRFPLILFFSDSVLAGYHGNQKSFLATSVPFHFCHALSHQAILFSLKRSEAAAAKSGNLEDTTESTVGD